MHGSVESAAKWFGGSLVIASAIIAGAIVWAARHQHFLPSEPTPPQASEVATHGHNPPQAEREPPPPLLADLGLTRKLVVAWNNKARCVPDAVNGGDQIVLVAPARPPNPPRTPGEWLPQFSLRSA